MTKSQERPIDVVSIACKFKQKRERCKRRRDHQQIRCERPSQVLRLDSSVALYCIVLMTNLLVTTTAKPSSSFHLHFDHPKSTYVISPASPTGRCQSMLRRRDRRELHNSYVMTRLLELRGGISGNGNGNGSTSLGGGNGDATDAALSDDDLDEYIEFLLAEAEGAVDESANPLFQKERKEMELTWDEDRPVVTPASITGVDATTAATLASAQASYGESEAQQLDEIIESLVDTVGEGETDQEDSTSPSSTDKDSKVDVLVQQLLENYEEEDGASNDAAASQKEGIQGSGISSSTEFFLGPSAVDSADEAQEEDSEMMVVTEDYSEATAEVEVDESAIGQPIDGGSSLEDGGSMEIAAADTGDSSDKIEETGASTATQSKKHVSVLKKLSRRFWGILGSKDAKEENDDVSSQSSVSDAVADKEELVEQEVIASLDGASETITDDPGESNLQSEDDQDVEGMPAELPPLDSAVSDEETLQAEQEGAAEILTVESDEMRIGDEEVIENEQAEGIAEEIAESEPIYAASEEEHSLLEEDVSPIYSEASDSDQMLDEADMPSVSNGEIGTSVPEEAISSMETTESSVEQMEAGQSSPEDIVSSLEDMYVHKATAGDEEADTSLQQGENELLKDNASGEHGDDVIALEADITEVVGEEILVAEEFAEEQEEEETPDKLIVGDGTLDSEDHGMTVETAEIGTVETGILDSVSDGAEIVAAEEAKSYPDGERAETKESAWKGGHPSIFKRIWGRGRKKLPEATGEVSTSDEIDANENSAIEVTFDAEESVEPIVVDQTEGFDDVIPVDEDLSEVLQGEESREDDGVIGEVDAEDSLHAIQSAATSVDEAAVGSKVEEVASVDDSETTNSAVIPDDRVGGEMYPENTGLLQEEVDSGVDQASEDMDLGPEIEEPSDSIEAEDPSAGEHGELTGSPDLNQVDEYDSVESSIHSDTDGETVETDLLPDTIREGEGVRIDEGADADISVDTSIEINGEPGVAGELDEALVSNLAETTELAVEDSIEIPTELDTDSTADYWGSATVAEVSPDAATIITATGNAESAEEADAPETHVFSSPEPQTSADMDADDGIVDHMSVESPEVSSLEPEEDYGTIIANDSSVNNEVEANDDAGSDANIGSEENYTTEESKEVVSSIFKRFWGAPVKSDETGPQPDLPSDDTEIVVSDDTSNDADASLATDVGLDQVEPSLETKRPFGRLFGTISSLLERKSEDGTITSSEESFAPGTAEEVYDDVPAELISTDDVADDIPTDDGTMRTSKVYPEKDFSSIFKKYYMGSSAQLNYATGSDGGSQHGFVRELLRKHPSLGSGVETDTGLLDTPDGDSNVPPGNVEEETLDELEIGDLEDSPTRVRDSQNANSEGQISGEKVEVYEASNVSTDDSSNDSMVEPTESFADVLEDDAQPESVESIDAGVEFAADDDGPIKIGTIDESASASSTVIASALQEKVEIFSEEPQIALDEDGPDVDLLDDSDQTVDTLVMGELDGREGVQGLLVEEDEDRVDEEVAESDNEGIEDEETEVAPEGGNKFQAEEEVSEEESVGEDDISLVDAESDTEGIDSLEVDTSQFGEEAESSVAPDLRSEPDEIRLDIEPESVTVEVGVDEDNEDEVDDSNDEAVELMESSSSGEVEDSDAEAQSDEDESSTEERAVRVEITPGVDEILDASLQSDKEAVDKETLEPVGEIDTGSVLIEEERLADDGSAPEASGDGMAAAIEEEFEESSEVESSEAAAINGDGISSVESSEITVDVVTDMENEILDQGEAVEEDAITSVEEKSPTPAHAAAEVDPLAQLDSKLPEEVSRVDLSGDSIDGTQAGTLEQYEQDDSEDFADEYDVDAGEDEANSDVDVMVDGASSEEEDMETAAFADFVSDSDDCYAADEYSAEVGKDESNSDVDVMVDGASSEEEDMETAAFADFVSDSDDIGGEDAEETIAVANQYDEDFASSVEEDLAIHEGGLFPNSDSAIPAEGDHFDEDDEEDDAEENSTSLSSSESGDVLVPSNVLLRLLFAREQYQLLITLMMISEWCKLYLAPLAELPGLIFRGDQPAKSPLAFLGIRGGGSGSSGLTGSTAKAIPDKDGPSEIKSKKGPKSSKTKKRKKVKADSAKTPGGDEPAAPENAAPENAAPEAVDSEIVSASLTQTPVDPIIPRVRPNPIYRFLLGKGYIGHTLVMETILTFAWIRVYLPDVYRLFNNMATTVLPSLRQGDEDDGMSASLATGFVASDGSTVRAGRKSKAQTRKADERALDQLKRVGDVKTARYRFVSDSFMKRHAIGPYRAEEGDGLMGPAAGPSLISKIVEGQEEESDTEWIEQALIAEDDVEDVPSPMGASVGLSVGSAGPSISVGVEFGSDEKRKKKRRKKVSDAVRGVSAATKKPKKKVGPQKSDRDSGVMGRIRAAGANSLFGRSVLGAYPGDALPPDEAGDARGLADVATKYGYGDWSDDEYDDDEYDDDAMPRKHKKSSKKRGKSKAQKMKSRSKSKKTSRKTPTSSISFGVELSPRSSNPPPKSSARTLAPKEKQKEKVEPSEKSPILSSRRSDKGSRTKKELVQPAMGRLNTDRESSSKERGKTQQPSKSSSQREGKNDSILKSRDKSSGVASTAISKLKEAAEKKKDDEK